jgi:hypothetical protein
MNQYMKVFIGILLYSELTLGVFQKWWPPTVLLNAIYVGMGAIGLFGSIHYSARYLQYKPDVGSNNPPVNPTQAQEGP